MRDSWIEEKLHPEPHHEVIEAIGQSEEFLAFQEGLSRVAPISRPVLILGERGTGKELAASKLHFLSKRWQGAFVTLNCAALSPSLIESELFGYEKSAFTGADRRMTGRFEAADEGTLFLDEIGTIPLEVQEKILRVVEYGTLERVGSSRSIEVDVRIISATNADLQALCEEGRFKRDLLDRLCFEVLILPPLRERKEDIQFLAHHFAARMAFEMGREATPILSEKVIEALEGYSWPGNVRELKNIIERAVYRSDSDVIDNIEFNPFGLYKPGNRASEEPLKPPAQKENPFYDMMDKPLNEAVRELKLHLVKRQLEASRHNQKQAAQRLGLTYDQFRGLYRKFKKELGA